MISIESAQRIEAAIENDIDKRTVFLPRFLNDFLYADNSDISIERTVYILVEQFRKVIFVVIEMFRNAF